MPFREVPLRVVGETSQNRSPQANNSLTKNWYPEITPDGRSGAVLLPWWGLKSFGTASESVYRGSYVFKDILYAVCGDNLYSINSSGTYASIGAIASQDRCIFSDNGDFMVITSGGSSSNNVYSYDGSTLTLATDTDFETPAANTMLNNQWLYDGDGDRFCVSDAGAPLDIDNLNFASAESAGDDLMRPYAFNQWVYMFGERTIEPWYNSGVGSPPFDRIDNGIMQKGLGALHSVANTDQFLYFFGDDGNVYQISQTQVRNISSPEIAHQMNKLSWANVIGNTVQIDGQDFYILSFDNNDLTYAYSEQTSAWFNLSSGVGDGRYLGVDFHRVYDKIICFDRTNSNAMELDRDTYTDLGNTIQRRRTLPPFNSTKIGLAAGQRILMEKAHFILQSGVGLVTGQGSDPQIMVEVSRDGGYTYEPERWINIGKLGEFLIKAEMYEMMSFYDVVFRITISDPVFSSLHDGSISIKLDGW